MMSAVREISFDTGTYGETMICIHQNGITVKLSESAIKKVITERSTDLAKYQMYLDMLIEHKKGASNAT